MERLLYEFLEHYKRKKYKEYTLKDYNRTIGEFLRFMGDNYPEITDITDITSEIILSYEKYLLTMKDNKGNALSVNRRRRYLTNLRKFFKYLLKENKLYIDSTVNIALPRERSRIIRGVLTVEDMDRLLSACDGGSSKSIRDRAILELIYSAGIRADELCSIELDDIDLKENLLLVRKGKWGNERIVPFGHPAKYWTNKYISNVRPLINKYSSRLLFLSMRGKKLTQQALWNMVQRWLKISGVNKRVSTHTLRHTCAVHMLKGRADIRYVQKQLGHKRISTTERYLKVEITDLKEIHEKCHPREKDNWE